MEDAAGAATGTAGSMRRWRHALHAGALFSVTDFTCVSDPGAVSATSPSDVLVPRDALLFVRRGALIARIGASAAPAWRRATLVVPGEALVLGAGSTLALTHPEASHPAGGATSVGVSLADASSVARGDRTTVLGLTAELADELRFYLGATGGGARLRDGYPHRLAPAAPRAALRLQALRLRATRADAFEIESAALALVEAMLADGGGRSRSGGAECVGGRPPIVGEARNASGGARIPARRAGWQLVQRSRELIAATIATPSGAPPNLAAFAAEVGASPFHLARTFRALTGSTLHQYRTRLRLCTALDRIAEGASLAGIALDLGFSSQAHFTTAFRRMFGVTPGAWRARATRRGGPHR